MAERIITSEVRRTYSVLLDIQDYRRLHALRETIPEEEFQRRLETQNSLVRRNLETSLGERFNADCLRINYYIGNGQLMHSFYKAPFLKRVELGQRSREQNGSTEVEREFAEVISFEKVQSSMTNPDFDPKAKIIVISPRGQKDTIYNHNFYDIYSKDENGDIAMSRFYSKSSYRQFYEAACNIDPFSDLPENPNDADFIARPLITYKSIEEIHQIFNRDEGTMSHQEFLALLKNSSFAISSYIKALAKNPFLSDEEYQGKYNAIPNLSDICAGLNLQNLSRFKREQIIEAIRQPNLREGMLVYLGAQTVRTTSGGCGLSGGYLTSTNNYGFQSVSEFATGFNSLLEDQYGTLEIHCEECGATYMRTPGKLEKSCRHCGGTRGIAC